MAWRFLLIEESGVSLQEILATGLGMDSRYERVAWRSLVPQTLRDDTADLILPVALDRPAGPVRLFRWMQDNPLRSPTLVILPEAADEELLCAAARVATDFMTWPARPEELLQRVTRILGSFGERSVRDRLLDELGLASLVGNDPAFLQVISQIPLIARSNRPVLISGETGTGKELCARAIHQLS